MNPIILIVGPPAVGKSSASRAVAARFPRSIHIPVDDLRTMVVSGLALPAAEWDDELALQVTLARETVIHMALAYRSAGFAVIIDDFWDPNRLADYRTLFSHPGVSKVILFPDQAEAHRRNLKRSGDSQARAYIDEGIRDVYKQLGVAVAGLAEEGWRVIDTTGMSINQTLEVILTTLSGPDGESR